MMLSVGEKEREGRRVMKEGTGRIGDGGEGSDQGGT